MKRRKARNGQLRRWTATLTLDGRPARGADGAMLVVTAYTAKAARHALKASVPEPFEVRPA